MAAGKRPSLIFDYDGTIHDTLRIYEPAVEQAFQWMRRQGYAVPEASGKKIASWLGMNTRDMWNSFLPDLIGDRYSDLEAAKSSGSPFIGCVYGFGSPEELGGAQRLAQTPEDLLNYL